MHCRFFSRIQGATTCMSCGAGTFAALSGSNICQNCTAGTYSSNLGSVSSLDSWIVGLVHIQYLELLIAWTCCWDLSNEHWNVDMYQLFLGILPIHHRTDILLKLYFGKLLCICGTLFGDSYLLSRQLFGNCCVLYARHALHQLSNCIRAK